MLSLADFSGGLAWDTESRKKKEEHVPWDIYKGQCGISIAVVVPLGKNALDGIEFYSDMDDVPWDPPSLVKRLGEVPISVGYNSVGWDRAVLAGSSGLPVHTWNELDLYLIIKETLEREGMRKWPKGTWGLDGVCGRTFRRGKSLSGGEKAPTLAEKGRWGELVKYCLTDVLLTRQLAWHMSENGYVVGPDNRVIQVWEVMQRELSRIRGAQTTVWAA